jgi:arylsulfatase A-like enzyme
MRIVRRILLGVALLILVPVACWVDIFGGFSEERLDRGVAAAVARPIDATRVILISIDGLAPWVMATTPTPNLDRLAARGITPRRAETVVPSSTMPSHASMISGLPPAAHGVDWNRYEPWREIRTPTLYSICRERGLRCGLIAGKKKFAHFAEEEAGVERYVHGGSADEVWAAASAYLAERDPDFMLVHVAEVDLAGHAHDWGSEEQRAAIRAIDASLGRFLAQAGGLGSGRLAVIVTADHGGHDARHGTDLPEDVEIPWILYGEGIEPGRIDDVFSTVDTGPTVLRLLAQPIPESWTGRARP